MTSLEEASRIALMQRVSSAKHIFRIAETAYIGALVNNRKEVIQCLIVYRRGRRHS